MSMTEIDQVLNERGAELERWLESGESLWFWEGLGVAVLVLLAAVILFRLFAGFADWATETWRRIVFLPVAGVAVVVALSVVERVVGYKWATVTLDTLWGWL